MNAFTGSFWKPILVLGLCLLCTSVSPANEAVYKKASSSCALVLRPDGGWGTGFLVDARQGLMMTAGHVIENGFNGKLDQVQVVFAQVQDGDVITDKVFYDLNQGKLAIQARVVYYNARRDLAILKLDHVPAGVQPLSFAKKSPGPGATIHVIGNSVRKHGGMFGYSQGKVRNVFLWDPPTQPILAKVVSHHCPTNKGDSGGPVLNDQGEVVAFVSMGTIGITPPPNDTFYGVQVTDHSIAVEEIVASLLEYQHCLAAR